MAATGLSYTAAAAALDAPFKPGYISITECMQENGWDYAEAVAFLEDPANELLCEVCGWTMGMICPECSKGCGCETRCSGWRHAEWGFEDDDDPASSECPECGGELDSPYGCDCPVEVVF
jgi:hypothetical protein